MPVVTYPQNPQKAVNSDVTLDKSELAAKPVVSQDPYFSNQDNWGKIIVFMRSAVGNQNIQYIFDATESVPAAQFLASDKARDDFEVVKLVINDFDGGSLTLNRDQLEAADFDFSFILDFILNEGFLSVSSDNAKFGVNDVIAIATDSQNNVYVGGNFTSYGNEQDRDYLVKFNSQGALDATFMSNAVDGAKFNNQVLSLAVDDQDNVFVAGDFVDYAGTTGRDRLIKLSSNGTIDSSYVSNSTDGQKFGGFPARIEKILIDSQNQLYVGGTFTSYDSVADRDKLIKLNADGTLNTTFVSNAVDGAKINGDVFGLALDSNENLLVVGSFFAYAGVTDRNRLIKLDSNGNLVSGFTSNASDGAKFDGPVFQVVVDSQDSVYVGGFFSSYDGVSGRNAVAKFDSNGSLDTQFMSNAIDNSKLNNVNFTVSIDSMLIDFNNDVYIGGSFQRYDGDTEIKGLLKFDENGNLDNVFINNFVRNKNLSGAIRALEESPAKSFYFGGNIEDYGIQDRNGLIRIG